MTRVLSALAVLVASSAVAADDKKQEKIDSQLLVGKWEMKEKKEGVSHVTEFTKGGKLKAVVSGKGIEYAFEADYTVSGNTLTLTSKSGDKELKETATITKLTDSELVLKSDKGKEDTMVRLKDKK